MKKKKRVDITAYRKRMGDFDKGFTLKEHREIDKDRKGDWDQEDIMSCNRERNSTICLYCSGDDKTRPCYKEG